MPKTYVISRKGATKTKVVKEYTVFETYANYHFLSLVYKIQI